MRLLFVTNLYPPHHIGGYELVCQRTAQGLAERGHTVRVLTSSFGSGPCDDQVVRRDLTCAYHPPDYFPDAEPADQVRNAAILVEEIEKLKPDVVLLWNLHGLGMHHLIAVALDRASNVATRIGDYQFWPDWDRTQPLPEQSRSLLCDPRLRCIVNGRAIGQDYVRAGIPADRLAVINSSVELPQRQVPLQPPPPPPPLRLVWSGRISPRKGLDIAVQGIRILVGKYRVAANLDVIGGGDESILAECVSKAEQPAGGGSAPFPVRYLGRMDREPYLASLPTYHAMVLSPVGFEAFGTSCAEAMAAGLPVVASRVGGIEEVTLGGALGLLFEPGNPEDLARQLHRLAGDGKLRRTLQTEAPRFVEHNYGRELILDRFETFLTNCAEGKRVTEMPPSVPKMPGPSTYGRGPSFGLVEAVRRLVRSQPH